MDGNTAKDFIMCVVLVMQNLRKTLVLTAVLLCGIISFAQSIKIGSIDIYGNRKIALGDIHSQLSIKGGDSINDQNLKPENIVAALENIPGVRHAAVAPICCDSANNMLLYIGISETDS